MNDIEKFESLRIEINEIKEIILDQEPYLKESSLNKNALSDSEEKHQVITQTLNKRTKEFKDFVHKKKLSHPLFLKERIQFHLKLIDESEHFSNDRCPGAAIYTDKRKSNIKLLRKSWKQLSDIIEVPETFRINEYELFFKIMNKRKPEQYEKGQLALLKIQEMEQIRQKITQFKKENFTNDIKLDKGSAWGISEEEIKAAGHNYSLIAEEILLRETELMQVLKDTVRNNFQIIELWILLHLYTCISVINYADTISATIVDKDKTRIGLAKETFENWEKVNLKHADYIIPNIYYLSDYDHHFNNIFKKFESQ